jgi:hypothetical protein
VTFLRRATISPAAARTAEYVLAFGAPVDVHVNGNGIEVFVHGPRAGMEPRFATLVTSGMSDTPMDGPVQRAELVLYARQPTVEHVRMLRRLASLPAETGDWVDLYHVVAIGERYFLLAPPPLRDRVESPFAEPLVFLWPIELHASEAAFLAEHGHAQLLDRLYGEAAGPPKCLLADEPRTPVA